MIQPGATGLDHAMRPSDYRSFAVEARSRGYELVLRYVCRPESRPINQAKIARRAELDVARAEGLAVALIWQDGKEQPDTMRGEAGGHADGAYCANLANSLGYPAGAVIVVAVDFDVQPAQFPTVGAYLDAFAGKLDGRWPLGVYGHDRVLDRFVGDGYVAYGMQTTAWSKGRISEHAHVVQRLDLPRPSIGGVTCDHDEVRRPLPSWAPPYAEGVPFVQAAHYGHGRRGDHIELLVLHSMEASEKGNTAEAIAAYFASGKVKASSHSCVDADSRVDCVADGDTAFAAPGANNNGLQLEQAGYARQSRADWLDPYSERMLREQTAPWLAEKARRFAVPLRFLRAADLKRAGVLGVTTHHEVSQAFGLSTHWDPGPGYPIDLVLAWASGTALPSPIPIPPRPSEDTMAPLTPSWAKRLGNGRVPFYRVLPGEKPSEATVLAYNGAPLVRKDGEAYGIPYTKLTKLAGTAIGLVELEDTGAVLVACEDGGGVDVAARPGS